MTNDKMQASTAEQLRLKLIGKPLVGFDTRDWVGLTTDGSAKGRVGGKSGKVGGKVGTKTAPART